MAIYDDASFIFLGSAAAGVDNKDFSKVPCVKPVEVTGSELLSSSDGDWTLGTGASINNGVITVDGSQSDSINLFQNITDLDNKSAKISFTISNYSAGTIQGQFFGGNEVTSSVGQNGTFAFTKDIGGSHNGNAGFGVSLDFAGTISDISIKEVTTKAADFDISRDSNLDATRVGPSGLIEKGRENLLLQSNSFDTTWTTNSASITGGQAGYDGSNNAWELKATGNGTTHLARVTQDSLSVSNVSTFSVHVKAGNTNFVRLNALTSGTNVNNYFDLSNGTVGSSPSATVVTSSIEAAGNGFYRISITSKGDAAISEVRIQVADADGDDIPATGSFIYIQDSQLEAGLVATDVITTGASTATAGIKEDEPRFDYPLAGGAPSLLIEPQRENKQAFSENFSAYTATRASVTANADTSPEGLENASKLVEDTTAGNTHKMIPPASDSYTSGTTYSISVFAKAAGRTQFKLTAGTTAVAPYNAIFTLTGESSPTTPTNNDEGTASMEYYGNGWYRCKIEGFEADQTASTTPNFFLQSSGNASYDGDGTSGILFYGFQLEEGKNCTSYIPTHGAAATRSTDNVAAFDTSGFSFGTTCTIFFEGVINEAPSSFLRPITMFASHASPSTAERFLLFAGSFSSGTYTLTSRHNTGGATKGVDKSSLTVGAKVKCASVFNGTSQKFFVNGDLAGTDTITAASVFNTLDLSQIVADQNHTVGSIMLFNSAISDADAFVLTDTSYESYSEAADSLNYIQHG